MEIEKPIAGTRKPARRQRATTERQRRYAQGLFAKGKTKKQIALEAGYPLSMARVPAQKIESRKGFHGAMAEIAEQTNNLGLKMVHILLARDLSDEDTKTLFAGVKVISDAMDKFQPQAAKEPTDSTPNNLRLILQQKVAQQTITVTPEQPQTIDANTLDI